MFCIKCGKQVPEGARFCPECGTPVYRSETITEDTELMSPEITLEIPEDVEQNLREALAEILEQPFAATAPADSESDISLQKSDRRENERIEEEEPSADGVDPAYAAASLLESALLLDSIARNTVPDEICPEATAEEPKENGHVLDLILEDPQAAIAEPSGSVDEEPSGIELSGRSSGTETPETVSPAGDVDQPESGEQEVPPAYMQSWENKPAESASAGTGKAKKWIFLLLILALIGTIIGYVIYMNSPSVKYKKAMGLAEDAFAEENYELAMDQYLQAMTFQHDEEAENGYYRCADLLAVEAYGRNDYRSAIHLYRDLKEYCPDYCDTADEYIRLIYSDWILNTAEEGFLAEATLLLQEAESWGYDMDSERSVLDSKLAEAAVYQRGVVIAEVLASYIDNGDSDAMFEYMCDTANPFCDELYDSGVVFPVLYELPLSSSVHTYEKAGFFLDGGYYVYYYGGFQGDVRDGYGTSVVLLENSSGAYRRYLASGEWSGGYPNGTFTEKMFTMFSDGTTEEVQITSNVRDGLYDGEVIYDYTDDDIYFATFENGKVVVLDSVDPNGNESNVIAYNADRSAWIFRRDGATDKNEGIIGFEE